MKIYMKIFNPFSKIYAQRLILRLELCCDVFWERFKRKKKHV